MDCVNTFGNVNSTIKDHKLDHSILLRRQHLGQTTNKTDTNYVMIFNGKSDYYVFDPYNNLDYDCTEKYIEDYKEKCVVPPFVQNMNETLFQSIEGIVDFDIEVRHLSGHLFLFEIDGKPKICFALLNHLTSEEVKH